MIVIVSAIGTGGGIFDIIYSSEYPTEPIKAVHKITGAIFERKADPNLGGTWTVANNENDDLAQLVHSKGDRIDLKRKCGMKAAENLRVVTEDDYSDLAQELSESPKPKKEVEEEENQIIAVSTVVKAEVVMDKQADEQVVKPKKNTLKRRITPILTKEEVEEAAAAKKAKQEPSDSDGEASDSD
jgi:hypothetical protein